MCGRFSQALPAEFMARLFRARDGRQEAPAPSWNVAPTARVTAAIWDRERAARALVSMDWGLLASWERHPDTARLRPINARCETVAASRMFAPAFRRRRTLIAVDAWYEWVRNGGQKVPHALARSDGRPTVLGGIWECWRNPLGGRLLSLAIVTTPAAPDLAWLHDRMPLVLEEADWPVWLGDSHEPRDGCEPSDGSEPLGARGLVEAETGVMALLRPASPGSISAWRIGRAVGNPRNDGAGLLAAA